MPPRRRSADQGDRSPYRCVPQRRASLGPGGPVRALPSSTRFEPDRPPSPLRRGALAGGPAQRHRTSPRVARVGLHRQLRHRPALDRATEAGCVGATTVRPDSLDAPHHPVADRRSGRAVTGGSRLHRSALQRRAEAEAGRRGRPCLCRPPAPERSCRTDAMAGGCSRDRSRRLRHRAPPERGRRPRGHRRALEQRSCRGAGQPSETDQAEHVRPRQVRSPAPARPTCRVSRDRQSLTGPPTRSTESADEPCFEADSHPDRFGIDRTR